MELYEAKVPWSLLMLQVLSSSHLVVAWVFFHCSFKLVVLKTEYLMWYNKKRCKIKFPCHLDCQSFSSPQKQSLLLLYPSRNSLSVYDRVFTKSLVHEEVYMRKAGRPD